MSCAFINHECLKFPDPDPANNKTCQAPTNHTLKHVDPTMLNGDWNVVEGYSHIYDCITCTWVNMGINASDDSVMYETDYYYK